MYCVAFRCSGGAAENDFLEFEPEAGGTMDDLIGHSIGYRVAVGPRAGQRVFALQTLPAREAEPRPGVGRFAGFSLHASIEVEAAQRGKLVLLQGMGFGVTMAIVALLIHSAVDFNLQIPANAALFVFILALGWISRHWDPLADAGGKGGQ